MPLMTLKDKTIFITGASRGIGHAIAIRAARDGANVAIAAKTTESHPKLPGTIFTAAEDVKKAGGKALPLVCDIRFEDQVRNAIEKTAQTFGGIDILINNASAISLTNTTDTSVKRFDLMNDINCRGTWLVSKLCIPYLIDSAKAGRNPHILNLSPPLDMREEWFAPHVAYTMAKYGMSMCVLGLAGELREHGIAVNALWPRTSIHTAAVANLFAPEAIRRSRKPEIVADAAYVMLNQDSRDYSGNFAIDDAVLHSQGIADLAPYANDQTLREGEYMLDFFLPKDYTFRLPPKKVLHGFQVARL
mmetsp:Transcript_26092/g.44887  ORF Transcript_26092/g.44887 Transcript_26092/m.44887 type:complete len:304 (+) Transcript_26092:36-947(+)